MKVYRTEIIMVLQFLTNLFDKAGYVFLCLGPAIHVLPHGETPDSQSFQEDVIVGKGTWRNEPQYGQAMMLVMACRLYKSHYKDTQ